MAITQDRPCRKCGKRVRMTRCEICQGVPIKGMTLCRKGCNLHGWLCPVHGKNY